MVVVRMVSQIFLTVTLVVLSRTMGRSASSAQLSFPLSRTDFAHTSTWQSDDVAASFPVDEHRGCPFPGPTNAPILVLPLLTVLHTVLMPKPMCHRDLSPSVDHTCRWLWPTWVAPAADLGHLQPVHDFLVNSASPLVTTVIFNSSSLFFSVSSPKSNSSFVVDFNFLPHHRLIGLFNFRLNIYSAQTVPATRLNATHNSFLDFARSVVTVHDSGDISSCTTTGTSTTRSRNCTRWISTVFITVWMVGIWRCTTTVTSTVGSMIRSEARVAIHLRNHAASTLPWRRCGADCALALARADKNCAVSTLQRPPNFGCHYNQAYPTTFARQLQVRGLLPSSRPLRCNSVVVGGPL